MSVLGDVFGSLKTMSQLQLLLAFLACTGYAFAQGSLLPFNGRRVAWFAAALSAVGFAAESSDWTFAAMLLGFAVAGMGGFIALVWITSRILGLGRSGAAAQPPDSQGAETIAAGAAGNPPRATRPGGPAHSV